MPLSLKLFAATIVFAGLTSAALAEPAPSCPGGGTATGTFSCTGPVTKPVCTEGPPWKCAITNNGGVMTMDGFGGGNGGGNGGGRFGLQVFDGSMSLFADD